MEIEGYRDSPNLRNFWWSLEKKIDKEIVLVMARAFALLSVLSVKSVKDEHEDNICVARTFRV